MLVYKKSVVSGVVNEMEIPVSPERIAAFFQEGSPLVQNAFPELNVDQREFLVSGITPTEWNNIFGEDE